MLSWRPLVLKWHEAQLCNLQPTVRLGQYGRPCHHDRLTRQVSMPCDQYGPTCHTQLLLGLLL